VSVVLCRPHITHCTPICAVLHIGHGAFVFVVRAHTCVVVVPHTFVWEEASSTSIFSTRGEKGLSDAACEGGRGDWGLVAFLEFGGGRAGGVLEVSFL
jgi:hypothetical protein